MKGMLDWLVRMVSLEEWLGEWRCTPVVSGSQSLIYSLEEQKLMSFADNLASQTQCTMGLWET